MNLTRIAKVCHVESASAAVETAVLLPFLTLLALGTVDLGRFTYAEIAVATSARNGAVYGSGSTTAAKDTAGIKSAALAEMTGVYGVTSSNPTVTSSYISPGGGAGDSVRVAVSFQFKPIVSYPTLPKTLTLVRTVEMRIMPGTKSDDDDDDDDDD